MSNRFDFRQSIYRGTLNQIGNQTNPEGDNLLNAINNQLTPLLRMSANSPASLVVNVGGGDLTDSETNRRRAIPHVGTAYVQFTSGTVTFPATSGGNITCSPGTVTPITVGVGNYAAVLIYLDGSGNLNALPGADSAVLNTAITNLPPSPDETLPLGFIVVQNVAGTIQNITQANIAQFGTGAGGGGSGNVTAVEAALRDYNNFAQTKYLDPNIFRQTKATKVDGASTGAFDLVKNAFKFTSVGQTFVSTNLANAEFLAEGVDIADAHLYVHWLLGFIDPSATYEVSRDGGTNWQSVTMSRVGTASNAWRGYKLFTDESVQQNLQTVAATGAGDTLNATTNQELSSQLVLSTTSVVRSLDLLLNRASSASVGNLYVQIVKNNAGVPSTAIADIVAESSAVNISTLSTGDITVTVDMPDTVLTAGTYHVVLRTDAAYKAGTMNLSWRSGAGTNGATYNGTSWTGSASTKAATIKGRAHDLRVRITSATGNTFLEGIGVYFPSDDGMVRPNGTKYVQRFYFTGDENRTQFTLDWTPDPDLLDIIDPYRGQSYAIEYGVASLSGNTVTFAADTFDFPGEDIVLIFRQVKGVAIDNSDANAAKNSEQDTNLTHIGEQISDLDFVTIPKIVVPNTQIVNRAMIPDLSQDLNARMGINRIMVQQAFRLENEFGPNGEPVFGVTNDRLDQVRLVGNWVPATLTEGPHPLSTTINDFVEITFYGTGLNLLAISAAGRDIRATVDGGSEGANLFAASGSGVITGRNYSDNTIHNVVSGLSLGIHTVKLRLNAINFHFEGFEVLNESSNIVVNPGNQYVAGKKKTLATQQSFAYNTSFETGTLGTRGGRVLVYQKADGTIAKRVTPTDSSQLNLAAANHANEEIVRTYNWREFGAHRTDDFSALNTVAGNRIFTLDDGTTSLVGANAVYFVDNNSVQSLSTSGAGNYLTFTFVGTGLDIKLAAVSAPFEVITVSVDGSSIGTISCTTSSFVQKIVSGLPYGTHTVRLTRAAANNFALHDFIVYQPKTPTLPTGAKAIAAYNIMADYVGTGITGTAQADNMQMPAGTLFKTPLRENIYVGANWSVSAIDANSVQTIPGTATTTLLNNSQPLTYTFYGTGLVLHMGTSTAGTYDFTVSIDGALNASGVVRSNASNLGGGSYRSTSSAAAYQPVRIEFTGLSLGEHTITVQRSAGTGNFTYLGLHIITPIHSHKSNLYSDLQNTLTVGSQGIEDLRKITSLEQITNQKAIVQAVGVTSSPTTTATVPVPMPDMSCTIKTNGGRLKIDFASDLVNLSANATVTVSFYINGSQVGIATPISTTSSTQPLTATNTFTVPVNAGTHKVDVYWSVGVGTGRANGTNRILTVEEV